MKREWSLAVGALLLGTPAWVQDVASLPINSELEEIVVTAQREEELVHRAALPVDVVLPNELRNAGVTRPSDLTNVVPALQVAGLSGSYTVYYMRGVGNFSGNSLAEPALTFNFDGVSIGRPSRQRASSTISRASKCSKARRGRSKAATPLAARSTSCRAARS